MNGKRIGYKRVSTLEQNPDSQLNGLDFELDKIFTDIETGYSTKNNCWPAMQNPAYKVIIINRKISVLVALPANSLMGDFRNNQ